MKKSTYRKHTSEIQKLRQQIHLEEDRGKLRDLVFRLQAALNHERQAMPAGLLSRRTKEENPFDQVIVG